MHVKAIEQFKALKVKATVECPVEGKEVTLKHCTQECARYDHIAYRGQSDITIYCKKAKQT